MQFQITDIEFDFDDDYEEAWKDEPISQQEIIDDHIGMIVEADDADDMIDEITSTTGWCIKSIDYRIILK